MKHCKGCDTYKEISFFTKNKRRKDGREKLCKDCYNKKKRENYTEEQAKHKKEYRKNKSKKIKDYNREYYENNKIEILIQVKNYANKNKDKKRAYNKKYYEENKITIKLQKQKYQKENQEKISKRVKAYLNTESGRESDRRSKLKKRALKISTADGTITKESLKQLREKQNNRCYYCKCELDFKGRNKVHLDHYIPLSKGGVHSITNVVYSCKKCNLTKSDTIPKTKLEL